MSLQSFLDPKKQSEETTIDTDRYISYSIIPLLPLESIFLSDKGQINHYLRVKRRQSQPYYASRCFPSLSSVPSSIIHPYYYVFVIQGGMHASRSDPPVFLFFITSVDTFLLNEIIVHRLFHTHGPRTRLLFADGLRTGCTIRNPECSSCLVRQDERASRRGCWPGPTTGEP